MANAKGMKALHDVNGKQPSRSASIVRAIREVTGFPTGGAPSAEAALNLQAGGVNYVHADGTPMSEDEIKAYHATLPSYDEGEQPETEQSKPIDREPPAAPSLYVPGMEAIRQAGQATEQDRVREYGLLAEIDAKLEENAGEAERIAMVIEATEATLRKARSDGEAKAKVGIDLTTQRQETVDRIVKLNQTAIDHEAARLRRGQ